MTPLASTRTDPPWQAVLHGLGLHLGSRVSRKRASEIRFGLHEGWGRFETQGSKRGDVLANQLGQPGLWKLRSGHRRSGTHGVFELPPPVIPRASSDANGFESLARWALATADGKRDGSWTPPPRDEIERRLPERALTLQVGSIALQGTMTHEVGRLAFSFPIVQRIPEDLPAPRMAWLRELLVDGQDCWRLVRIGLTADGEARAEIDLGGAPHDVIDALVPISVDALRLVVSLLAEPAEFLVHLAEADEALELPPLTRRRPR